MNDRIVYAKIIFAITLCASATVAVMHGFLSINDAKGSGVFSRTSLAREALEKIIDEPHDLVIFYGSSMTGAGFSPRKFDKDLNAQGKNIKSFNYGFGGLNPYFQDYLSRRIKDEFEAKDRRLKLAMIEFNPFQTTKSRWNGAVPVVDSFLSMLANDREIFEIAKQDITRGFLLFNIKYLRDNISSEIITSFYGRGIFPPYQWQQFKDSDEIQAARREIGNKLNDYFNEDYPNFVSAGWSYEWQGAGTIPEERSEKTLEAFDEYYDLIQTDAQMKNDRLSRIRSADIEELNFEPLLVDSFIQIIKNFQQFSDNVEVIMLPRNTKWITNTPGGKERLADAIKQIEKATGVTIRNHQDLDFINPSMFRDTTHLARYRGDIIYTDFLVKNYTDIL
ncbi:MAG: hypothetical protein ACI9IA_001774 [Enterobacterales bacterium]|jgi:hypothetical protein